MRNGGYEAAARNFDRAIELNDRILGAYVGMGVAQQAMGQTEEALASFEMAAGIEPNSTLLFSEIARLQLKVSAAQQARAYLEPSAIAQAPQGPPEAKVRDLVDQQIHNVRAVLCEHPHHADLHYRLGLLLRQSGDLSGAIASFHRQNGQPVAKPAPADIQGFIEDIYIFCEVDTEVPALTVLDYLFKTFVFVSM